MKIYTRTGDTGTTGLFGGPRVSKHHIRIDGYGTVDELNSILGVVRVEIARISGQVEGPTLAVLDATLGRLQKELFVLGADLATPEGARAATVRVEEQHIRRLEEEIDALDSDLPDLTRFILPGGSGVAAHMHMARVVCRRAERLVVALSEEENINEWAVMYLNRLSDYFFTAARAANVAVGVSDNEWLPPSP